jgi:transposase
MHRLGYSNRGAFWAFVHAAGVPYIKLNARTARFDEQALEAWLKRRTVGGAS